MNNNKTIDALLAQLKVATAQQAVITQSDHIQELIKKSAEAQAELDYLMGEFQDGLIEATDSLQKASKIKSRGIALCHKEQGYSANNRPVSLLTKSRQDLEKSVSILREAK